MSAGQKYALNVKQLTTDNGGIGDVLNVLDMEIMTIQMVATGTGTVQFEGTIDGTNWFPLGAALTASGAFNVPYTKLAAIRAHTTVSVAGGVYSAALAGAMRGE